MGLFLYVMKYVAAYLLAALGGKAEPSSADVTSILKAAGADVDSDKLAALLKSMEGKSLDEILAAGRSKISSMAPAAGGGGGAAPAAAGGAAPAAAAKEPEPEEEEGDDDMGFSLFD